MTFRTTSVRRQWQAWACLALVGVVTYFVLVSVFGLGNPLRFFGPHQMRVLLPLVVVLRILAREFRWDGIVRKKVVAVEGQDEVEKRGGGGERNLPSCARSALTSDEDVASPLSGQHGRARTPAAPQSLHDEIALKRDCGGPGVSALPQWNASGAKRHVHSPTPTQNSNSVADSTTGEALFARACAMPHQEIPDFEFDGPYLDLLGRSATAGYAPAMAQLGDYAMDRAAWVEAYYWMSMAKRRGMQGLANVMREIRWQWMLAGCPDQAANVYAAFPAEAGSIGRALLHVDSGRDAARAREFLKEHYPDFASRGDVCKGRSP